ncbi:MAG: glycosyl hydrolase family 65 protein [bacterium]
MKINNNSNSSNWKLIYTEFNPAEEHLRETLCTLGNGYMGTRGSQIESYASKCHYPGTYLAGVYNKTPTNIAGRTIYNEDLVNCTNWQVLRFKVGDGEWISTSSCRLMSFYQELDLLRGMLVRKMRIRDSKGNITRVESNNIVHMGDCHRAAVRLVLTPENYNDTITVRSELDGSVQNLGVKRYRDLNTVHLEPYSKGAFGKNGIYITMKTSQSDIKIAVASKVNIFSAGREIKPSKYALMKEEKRIAQEFQLHVRKKKSYEIEKICAVYTSKDKGIKNHSAQAITSVKESEGFRTLFKTHQKVWKALWNKFDIEISGDNFAQRVLRLHIFHLLQTASIHNTKLDTGLPARGLHGEAYRGHIFWDELFAMPFYDFRMPKISESILLYRYRRLAKAELYAKTSGYRGAMFPWQSGSTGEEETQVVHLNPLSGDWGPDHSSLQRHVSFAIAFNVWKHWERTHDNNFLIRYGAEMLLMIAQFGASLTILDLKDKRYHTEKIMGPDEFHEMFPGSFHPGLKDNTYTNLMIVWTICRAKEALGILPKPDKIRLTKKLGLTESELNRWDAITKKVNIIFNKEGIISQFKGYFKLKEIDFSIYKNKYGSIERMDRILKAEKKSPNDYKVVKQADALMIFYLMPFTQIVDLFHMLGYKFDKKILERNYDYYIKRTSHGSTLSKVVYCCIAHLLGRKKQAWQLYLDVLKSDIYDVHGGTVSEGIHCGVMGASIFIAAQRFGGISILCDRIKIEPDLPQHWRSLKFKLLYRGHWISLKVSKNEITIVIQGPKPKRYGVPIEIDRKTYHFTFGKRYRIPIS